MPSEVAPELVAAGRGYERLFVPALFSVWTQYLVDAAGVRRGCRVLDLACGTGVLARAALARTGPGGRVVAIDPAPGMLAAAREIEAAVEWLQGSAEAIDLPDASFDCVLSQFGIMFFEDRPRAVAEMWRVLKPGGSLAIAAWRSVDHNPAYRDVIAVLEQQVGTAAADALRLPYSLGDAAAITDLLEDAGFVDVDAVAETATAVFPGSRQMVEAELRGWLPLFDIRLSETQISAVLEASDRTLGKYATPSGEAVFPTAAHVVSARKP